MPHPLTARRTLARWGQTSVLRSDLMDNPKLGLNSLICRVILIHLSCCLRGVRMRYHHEHVYLLLRAVPYMNLDLDLPYPTGTCNRNRNHFGGPPCTRQKVHVHLCTPGCMWLVGLGADRARARLGARRHSGQRTVAAQVLGTVRARMSNG